MKTITFTLTVSDEALDCNEFAGGNHRRRKRRRSLRRHVPIDG